MALGAGPGGRRHLWTAALSGLVLAASMALSLLPRLSPRFEDQSEGRLPDAVRNGTCMDARAADLDQDGDLDLVLSMEKRENHVLLNDGDGFFEDLGARLPQPDGRDTEAAAVADFNGDGRLDIVFVTEDDLVNEYYLSSATSLGFVPSPSPLPVEGKSNAVLVIDFDGDDAPDLLIANDGQNFALVNDGTGHFIDDTANRLPARADTTQDLALGDVDGDGDIDLAVANESDNRLLLNDGAGHFTDAPTGSLPTAANETRDVDLDDVDGDGDLDIFFGNVRFIHEDAQNRLLLNDGRGHFEDVTETHLPRDDDSTFDVEFVDLDGDGDLDLAVGNSAFGDHMLARLLARTAGSFLHVYENDGRGHFTEATLAFLGRRYHESTFDIAAGDFDGDGLDDLFICNRGINGRGTEDRLLLRTQGRR